jgi:hypothetical protein
VRGTGKSDKQGFYNYALRLHKAHPKTLALNIGALADFGYLKDLPEILYRLLEGPEVRKLAKKARGMKMFSRKRKANSRKFKRGREGYIGGEMEEEEEEEKGILEERQSSGVGDKEKARASKATKALYWYNNDSDYRFLFDCVCDMFAELLKLD